MYFPSENLQDEEQQDSVFWVTNLKNEAVCETFLAAFPLVYLLTNRKKEGKGRYLDAYYSSYLDHSTS